MPSFARLATETATTKRSPVISGNKRGVPVAHITTAFACTPLDPADSERARDLAFRLRQGTQGAFELLECYVDASLDIREGDVLVVDSRDYPIRGVGVWSWKSADYLHLIVEDIRRGAGTVTAPTTTVEAGGWIGIRAIPTYPEAI